jgi:group II intron reverse transcriptase/maturase
MDPSLCADGATLNPFECCTNVKLTDPSETDQSSKGTSSDTSPPHANTCTDPNRDIFHKESTTGFPKGSNPYGDGVSIIGFSHRVRTKPEVRQRFYSTGPDAASEKYSTRIYGGTGILSELTKLNNGKFTGLYKCLTKEAMILHSYNKIKSKPGNMTPGTDNLTLDEFSPIIVQKLANALRDETFQFKPVKRVYIPKKNGKMRPLGVPSPRDKVIQESMRYLLELIFEPEFLSTSHGFRPNRSCHTALKQTTTWNGYTWCIEGDIKGFFDNVDHHILEKLLRKYIEDQQFIDLYWKLVKAGYVASTVYGCIFDTKKGLSYESKLGVPQGGIISPILSNIYLHELDLFVNNLTEEHSSKERAISKVNPKISSYSEKLTKLNTSYQLSKDREILKDIKKLRLERNQIPSRIRTGIRISYVRYADDWIIGIIGTKELATTIKNQIATFLANELKITLSPEKTKISHFRKSRIKFLGVYLTIPKPTQSKIVL